MWILASPKERSSYLTEHMGQALSVLPRHKFMLIAVAMTAILMAAVVVLVIQNSAAGTRPGAHENTTVSIGAHSTIDDPTIPNQPATLNPAASESASDSSADSSTSTTINQSSSSSSSSTKTELTVNGKNVTLPNNGTVNKTITTPEGTTNLNVSVSHTASGDDHTRTRNTIKLNTNTSSKTSVDNSE